MSGHSKWATIKRKKGVLDSRRGAMFTKLGKNISIAAKNGKDPDMNPALRVAVEKARAANMPKDNIEKAILKGAGELPGAVYEELIYEGYGPGGIAMLIECVTDNTNRTVSFVRSSLTKAGGSLGSSNSVKYQFSQKGVFRISVDDLNGKSVEDLEMLAIENGAEDMETEAEGMTITVEREQFAQFADLLQKKGITPSSMELEWVTQNMVTPEPAVATKLENLIETLEEDDDVNAVHTNAAI